MQLDRAEDAEERRAHVQFATDFAKEIRNVRDELGAPGPLRVTSDRIAVDCDTLRHAACVTSRVVLMTSEELPYTVVVAHDGAENSRRSFLTMRQAEAYLRLSMPTPAPRSTLYDRQSGQV